MLINCPEILIKNPTTSHRLIGSFNSLSFKKMRFDPFDPSPTFKGRSGTVKMVELSNGTPVPIKIV